MKTSKRDQSLNFPNSTATELVIYELTSKYVALELKNVKLWLDILAFNTVTLRW